MLKSSSCFAFKYTTALVLSFLALPFSPTNGIREKGKKGEKERKGKERKGKEILLSSNGNIYCCLSFLSNTSSCILGVAF